MRSTTHVFFYANELEVFPLPDSLIMDNYCIFSFSCIQKICTMVVIIVDPSFSCALLSNSWCFVFSGKHRQPQGQKQDLVATGPSKGHTAT